MEITLKNFQKKIPIPRSGILKAAKAAFRRLHFKPRALSIVFAGAKRMRALNKKYLKHDYATDVLAFDLGDGFAEIIICPRAALANARRYKTTTDMEIMTYTIHGILHLAGHDDHEPGGMLRMRRVENELMRKISPV